MISVVLSLGSNLGDRAGNIQKMESALFKMLNPPFLESSLMETEPLGISGEQAWFLNRVVSGYSDDSPLDFLAKIQKIERDLGRDKKGQVESRTADIDILLFGDKIIKSEELTIPHRAILKRRFCLEGLNEIIPQREIPGTGQSVKRLFEQMEQSVRAQKVQFLNQDREFDG